MSKKITIRADKGSTMSNLAEILGTTVEELKKYNNLDSNIVKVGQEFSWETDDVEGIKTRLFKVQNRLQQKRQAIIDAETKKKADENAKRNMQWVESKRQDYGDLTQHQIRDYQNFVKSGKGKTIADFKAYKEKESKDAQSTRDLALKAGQGIVGMAGLTSLGTTALPELANTMVGNIARSIAGSELARKGAEKSGLGETGQTIAGYLGGGLGGLHTSLLKNGVRSTLVEGASNAAGLAIADQTAKSLEGTPNYIKVPTMMLTSFFGRRGFNSAIRNSTKNTKWGENLLIQNKNNVNSAFSSQGHIQPYAENTKNIIKDYSRPLSERGKALLNNGIIYGGAQTIKAAPIIGIGAMTGGAQDIIDNYTDNELIKESMHYIMPHLLNKGYSGLQNFNRGQAQFFTYGSGGTGKGPVSAIQNMAKIALGKPKLVNAEQKNTQLGLPSLIKGLGISAWDSLPIHYKQGKFGRNYKPGGYGFLYYTTKGNQGGSWHNLNVSGYQEQNPINHMYLGSSLGKGVQSSGQHVRLGNPKNNMIDQLAQKLFPKGSGYDVRFGDRPLEVVLAGNKVDLSKGRWAKTFDRHGNVKEWTTNPSEATVRHANYNVDTGHRVKLNNKTQNLTVNTKGQQTMVWQSPEGNTFSIGGDMYGVGSGKTNLLSSIQGAYMDAYTNPIITLSANKYTPTKSHGVQSFGSEIYKNLPHYKRGGKLLPNVIGL